ncbi:MAG: hypothetical protein IJB07_04315, partial [Firmicutes bacterium]|nr:hypothetical protein [Bacillota bacterium]
MGQGVSPKEAAARAGLAAGVELLNASGMADEALGAAVKKTGLMDTVVELGRKIPGAKQIIDSVEERLDAALMKLGMDFESLNLLPAYRDGMINLTEALN